MNYRTATLWPAESLTAAAVRTVNLRGLDPISDLILTLRYTNNGNTPTEHPAKILKSIQVVDGSEVLVSLSGFEADALQYYHYRRPSASVLTYIDDNIGTMEITIPFGLWKWDPMLALDPARFNNLQVVIDTDLSLGGSAPDALSVELKASMFDGKKVSPKGLICSRRHYTYSLVASGIETVDLPTDRAIYRIMLQSIARTVAVNGQFSNLKASEDNDKKIWFDLSMSKLIKDFQGDLPPYLEHIQANVTTGGLDVYSTPCYEDYLSATDIGTANAAASASYKGGGKHTIDVSANSQILGLATGWCPHGSFAFEPGDRWDVSDAFIPRPGGIVKLFVTGGSGILAASTAQVVLQTVKQY